MSSQHDTNLTEVSAEARQPHSPAPIPDHVPPHLVIDPSPYLARFSSDLDLYHTEDIFENTAPIFYTNQLSGFDEIHSAWIVTRHKDIHEVYQNHAVFANVPVRGFASRVGETFPLLPLHVDPPEHTKLRIFLHRWFAPKAVKEREAGIRAVICELIDGFAQKGECDVAHDFGRLFPVCVFLDLMGFPREALEEFLSWEHAILHSKDEEARKWGLTAAIAWLRGYIERARAGGPTNQLASYIVHGKVGDRPLTDDEILGMLVFLWVAGLDTVAAMTGFTFRRLALMPDLQQRLREKPELIPDAVVEFLRLHPVVDPPRRARQDYEIGGVKIKKGDWVIPFNSSGNFDPEEFEDPRTFRLDRRYNRHFTFGGGPHRCLGESLARSELAIALTEFLRRIPQFSPKPGAKLEAYSGLIAAPRVPIIWDAAAVRL